MKFQEGVLIFNNSVFSSSEKTTCADAESMIDVARAERVSLRLKKRNAARFDGRNGLPPRMKRHQRFSSSSKIERSRDFDAQIATFLPCWSSRVQCRYSLILRRIPRRSTNNGYKPCCLPTRIAPWIPDRIAIYQIRSSFIIRCVVTVGISVASMYARVISYTAERKIEHLDFTISSILP